MSYKEIEGDLIAMAQSGAFDVIAHGCNCFCRMKRGIAPQMAEAFGTDKFPMEKRTPGEYNKLGQIDFKYKEVPYRGTTKFLRVVNCYTQYHWDSTGKPLDYEALTLCLRKINHLFKGMKIGLPQIGCGLAGGEWVTVKEIIRTELTDCDVTVVIYKK